MVVGTGLACLGLLAFGIGLILLGPRLVLGDRSGLGIEGIPLVGGLTLLLLGGVILIIDRRRTDPTMADAPAVRRESAPGTTSRGGDARAPAPPTWSISHRSSSALTGLEARVVGELRRLCDAPERVEFVIFSGQRGYLQFAPLGPGRGLVAEAVGEAYLEPGQFRPEWLAALHALGFASLDPTQNLSLELAAPVDLDRAARIVLDGLAVYGDDPSRMEVETGAV